MAQRVTTQDFVGATCGRFLKGIQKPATLLAEFRMLHKIRLVKHHFFYYRIGCPWLSNFYKLKIFLE